MKKKFENMERRGLPGGPNEMFSYVTGVFSTEGYKSDSPDKNNPANLIASGSITMENVEFPVLGMDNLGNSKMMMPGNNYEFPGDMVLEIPMAQKGKSIDDEAQRKYLTDWLKARKATGRFDDQLNEKELNEYIKNIETVQQLTKDEFQTMFPETVSNFNMMTPFNSPSGQYVFDTDEIGKDNPKTHHYHAEPSFLTRFTNMFDGLDSVNSTKIHELTHAMTRSKGSGALRKEFPDAGFVDYPIEQAIRNIPIGFGDYYDDPSIFDSYEGDPEEILAQLMQYRYNFNVDPNKVFTKDDIEEVMDNVKKQGESGIFGLDIFTPENIIRLLNEVAAVDSKDTNTRVAQDGKETERSEGLNKIDTSKYNVRVINYPYGSKKFSPGHIESVLIDKDTGEQVNKIPGTDYVGYINRWSTMGGNKPVRKSDYEGKDDVRTVDLDLSEEDIRDYLQQAQMFQPTQKSRFHTQARMDTTKLPLSLSDDNMYEYDFIDSNCATGVCLGLGMDPDSAANSRGGITDPNFVMDNILENYSAAGKIVPGSITGTRTSRFEGLQNLVKRELPEYDLSGDTINVLTNYINSLDRDQINNAVETVLKNPTALKAIKNKGVDRIANRALTDLDAIVSDLLPGGDKPGRGRVEMAKNRLGELGYDIKDIYDNLPEGTIPAALKALYNERAQFIPQIEGLSDVDSFAEMTGIPINDLEFSMEGVKNIPNYWLNKLGFQKGGSVSWNWKGKTYSGTLIPSMEDENNRYARTKNGKIKTLPKGQKGVEQGPNKRTRADIYKDINRLNQQISDTDSQLDQFRKNIGTIYQGFQQAGDETLTDEQRKTELDTLLTNSSINPGLFVADTSNPNEGRVIGLDSVPKVTRDWLRSIGGYGCTTYGCGLLRQAGAVTEEGNPFPMISGNSQLNSMIERNEGGLQMRLMDPGFSDLVAGDRIVSNYSTSGGDGDAHTMIFTGEYDADGSPIVMENSGGWVPGGVSIRSLQDIKGYRDTSDPESGLRVTRYNLGRDKLQSELDKLKEEYMAADPEPQIQLSELKPASVNITPIEQQLKGNLIKIPIDATQRIQPKKQFAGEITNDVLLRQVFAESSLDPSAVSPAGARGLAQFMPNTETELKRLKLVNDNFDPLDPSQARNAQEAYMNYLSERPYLAKGSPEVQLAKVLYAYNRGPNAAKRNLTQLKNSYDIYNSLDWLEGINSESRSYINKILGKDEKFSKEYENILLDSTKTDMVKMYKQFGGDVDLKRIYKNFVEGIYENTNNQKRGRDIYDKLNRMYYREAKSAGMSMPNYVMTYIIGNS